MNNRYHHIRFTEDSRREALWKALWKYYFQYRINSEDTVLDLGCGYGNFINNVKAKNRIAIDQWEDFPKYIAPNIKTVLSSLTDLSALEDFSIDYAFASNVFEHMTQESVKDLLSSLRNKLSNRGQLTILQPNYRYCTSEYFDDYTHISVWSHVSLADFLVANDYEVTEIRPRFLPLTLKSRLPVHRYLIALYLKIPFKPMGKQMLISARPR